MSRSITAQIFDESCKLINYAVNKGEHPLVAITALSKVLKKCSAMDERFRNQLIADLSDMYFWKPEFSLHIIEKWHKPHFDIYRPYQELRLF